MHIFGLRPVLVRKIDDVWCSSVMFWFEYLSACEFRWYIGWFGLLLSLLVVRTLCGEVAEYK